MFKHLSLTFLCINLVLSASAQSRPAIISLFEHQTDTPVAYPNYFKDKSFTDQLIQIIQGWLQKNYSASSLDYKKIYPVSFVPVINLPGEPRTIEGTNYTFSLGVQTSLESGLVMDKYKKEEGVLRFNIWMMDKRGKKIFKNKIALKFIIALKPNNPNVVYLSQKDFQKLYLDGLRDALNIQPAPKTYSFQQPENKRLTKFTQQVQPQAFNQLDRGSFTLEKAGEKLKSTLTFEVPFQNVDVFSRAARFYNAINQKEYLMESTLKNSQPGRISTEIQADRKVLARFQSYYTHEEYRIEAVFGDDLWELKQNLFSRQIAIYKYKKLQALLLLEGGDPTYQAQYKLYLKPEISTLDQVIVMNLIGSEALARAVRKFHEVETRN